MTPEILLTLLVLLVTIVLFITEAFRIDIISITIMISLGWLGFVKPIEIFSEFASNAVISVIAVMILGYGIDRSGVMKKLIGPIINLAGTGEKRLITVTSASAGITSAFMQNIGATALFLPAVTRISKKIDISLSRLLMPKEEKKHETIMRNLVDLVNRPNTWLDDAEWYHLEDY
jgi:di/tricarboxylate transporter